MILAELRPPWVPLLVGGIMLIVLVILCLLIVKAHRWFTAAADRAQQRAFEGVQVHHSPGPGLVEVIFHVYSGVLVFTRQVEYRFWATPDNARLVLWRLHRFNLAWGLFAYGALFIPLLSIGNYLAQRRRISRQVAKLGSFPQSSQ